MQNLIMYKEGEQSWIRWIKKRIKNNLNFMAILEGATGSGKSWASCSIAHELDPLFNPKEQVCFSFSKIMGIINRFNDPNDELSKRPYKVIVFDEVQIDLSNRAWMDKVHKLFGYLTTTFRNQNLILLFTSPYSDFVDSATLKLIHARLEVRGWDKKTNLTYLRPKILQYNSRMKKFYEHSLIVIKGKGTIKLREWYLDKPPEEIIKAYEEIKTEFTENLNRRITNELETMNKKEQLPPKVEIIEIPATTKEKIIECFKKGITKPHKIATELGITRDLVYYHINSIKNEQNYKKILANGIIITKTEKPPSI